MWLWLLARATCRARPRTKLKPPWRDPGITQIRRQIAVENRLLRWFDARLVDELPANVAAKMPYPF